MELLEDWFQHENTETPDTTACVAQIIGQAFAGNPAQRLLFLYGPGGNGKTAFMDLLQLIFGPLCGTLSKDYLLRTRQQPHPTGLTELERRRLVLSEEIKTGARWEEALLKDITGHGQIAVRGMRQNYRKIRPDALPVIPGNAKPTFAGLDEAIKRRFALLPMPNIIPPGKRLNNEDMKAKLGRLSPAAAAWILDGLRDYQQNRGEITLQGSLALATQEYFKEQDVVDQAIRQSTQPEKGAKTPSKHVYEYALKEGIIARHTTRQSFYELLDNHPRWADKIVYRPGNRTREIHDRAPRPDAQPVPNQSCPPRRAAPIRIVSDQRPPTPTFSLSLSFKVLSRKFNRPFCSPDPCNLQLQPQL